MEHACIRHNSIGMGSYDSLGIDVAVRRECLGSQNVGVGTLRQLVAVGSTPQVGLHHNLMTVEDPYLMVEVLEGLLVVVLRPHGVEEQHLLMVVEERLRLAVEEHSCAAVAPYLQLVVEEHLRLAVALLLLVVEGHQSELVCLHLLVLEYNLQPLVVVSLLFVEGSTAPKLWRWWYWR